MSDPILKPDTIKVKQLVEDYQAGRIVIPEFQREYVWKPSKAPYLIDSLYRGFPISSLLLWQSMEEARSRRITPRPSRGSMRWLCATMPPKKRDARSLVAWLALAALLHRYSRSSESALDQDLRACRHEDPIGALLANLRQSRPSLTANPNDFAGALNDRSGLLASYVACMHRGVLDFFTGGKVLLHDAIDRHHILPRAQFPEKTRQVADSIANIAFISGDVNKSIGQSGPEVYLKRIAKRVLESQCVPTQNSLWSIDNADSFWAARRELLAASFNDFLRKALPQRKVAAT
jgi:hypothetical protein